MTIEYRLKRLERQNQRLQKGMIGIVMAGIALFLLGQSLPPKVPSVLKAKKIEIIGENGLAAVEIGSTKTYGFIYVFGKSAPIAAIGGDYLGNGVIETIGPNGESQVKITSNRGGDGIIETRNAKGKKMISLGTIFGDGGFLGTYDKNGRPLILIASTTSGQGRMIQFSSNGKPVSVWPSLE